MIRKFAVLALATVGLLTLGVVANTMLLSPGQEEVSDGDLKSVVPLDRIVSGGPPKDGIPSIDNPRFLKPGDVDFLSDSDVVIGVEYNGIARAYPLKILVWHEIVNDVLGDTPLVITYCPLCYSSIAFFSILDGKDGGIWHLWQTLQQ